MAAGSIIIAMIEALRVECVIGLLVQLECESNCYFRDKQEINKVFNNYTEKSLGGYDGQARFCLIFVKSREIYDARYSASGGTGRCSGNST